MLEFVLGYSMGKQPSPPPPSASRGQSGEGLSPATRIEDIEKHLDELALIVSAVWSLMERQGLSSEQLISKLEEFDRADGHGGSRLLECPSCHSKVAFGLQICQYCGTRVRTESGEPLAQTSPPSG